MGEVELYYSASRSKSRTATKVSSSNMISSEHKSEDEEEEFKSILDCESQQQPDLALYEVLDDKNKAIANLKKRLVNQEIQLNYYLNKTLNSESVMKFSEQCVPQLVEESMNSCLAMCKFLKESGEKSRLGVLHDELRECEERMVELLDRQEDLLQRVTEETIHDPTDDMEEELRFADRALQMAHLDLYSRLMSTTLKVSKELEQLRSHVERISALEEHRNALISHVFSLPSEQRLAGLRLAELECRLYAPGNQKPTLACEKTCDGDYSNSNLKELLQKIESDALTLLTKTEEQRNKFAQELNAAKEENQKLVMQLKMAQETNPDYKVDQLQNKCSNIEREIEEMKKGMDIEMAEKDKQIEQLESELREAVAKRFEIDRNESDREKEMEQIIGMQETQIKNLLKILSSLEQQQEIPSDVECSSKVVLDSGNCSTDSKEQVEDITMKKEEEEEEEEAVQEEEFVEESSVRLDEDTEDNYDADNEIVENDAEEIEHENEECVEEEEELVVEAAVPEEITKNVESKSDEEIADEKTYEDEEIHTEVEFAGTKSSTSSRMSRKKQCEGMATTSLKVEAYNKHGVKESMRATLESTTEVDGVLEMNNSSRVRLRLQCTSPRRRPNTYDRCCQTQQSEGQNLTTESGGRPCDGCSTDRSRWFSMSQQSMQLMERLSSIGTGLENILNNRSGRRALLENIRDIYAQFYGPANS